MSLLEKIMVTAAQNRSNENPSKFPIILNPSGIFDRLNPTSEDLSDVCLVKQVVGWEISEKDLAIIESGNKFIKNLKRKMKNRKLFTKELFLEVLNSFLEKTMSGVGITISEMKSTDPGYTSLLIAKVGMVVSQSIMRLVVDNCLRFELWDILGTILRERLITRSSCPDLVEKLVLSQRAELVVLCIQHLTDLQSSDVLFILRYFLSPSQDDFTILSVKKEWEAKTLSHIEKASGKLSYKNSRKSSPSVSTLKNAAVHLSVAYDGFLGSEICLHYLLASSNDGLVLSSAVSGLEPAEILKFVKYLTKWLQKYLRFPEVVSCSSLSEQDIRACQWMPSLDTVVTTLGMVIDQHFLCLILHPEFHDEVKFMQKAVKNLVVEARLARSVAGVVENLRLDVHGS